MVLKSKMKWIGLFGLVLSAFSLFAHFLLARYTSTESSVADEQHSITIFTWRPRFENADLPRASSMYRRLWGPVRPLESLHPHANPRGMYQGPSVQTNGFIFVKIQGGFHEIRNSICDAVVVSRLLNATLVIPELQSTTSSKGISSAFKSFAYLYNEEHFVEALAKDVLVVKSLPKNFKAARRNKEMPVFKVPYSASPEFYRELVLPVLKRHSVVELLVTDGGCLQAILPPHLEECQRLRCRVAFHALRFRDEVQELGTKILNRLRATGRPFLAYNPGVTRDALAYHGCAELFQDVHTELIQHRRLWMIKRGLVKEELPVNSMNQRLNGSCPLMPEEVGILLRAYGYSSDTIIYVSGGEIFGGQRVLIPLHAMFENVVDRTSLSTARELASIYGHEECLISSPHQKLPLVKEEMDLNAWKKSGPRPRPLPPPPARPKYPHNIEGWWGWVAEIDKEPVASIVELRTNAHKLLWEAIDYIICVEADAFFPGFDRDGKGRPSLASLVMGHRLYQSTASKTFRPDRRVVVKLLEEIRDHLYQANRTWLTSVRKHLSRTVLDGLTEASSNSKLQVFLSHPVPECSCSSYRPSEASSPSGRVKDHVSPGVEHRCPAWMDANTIMRSEKDKEREEELDEDDPRLGQPFQVGSDREVGGPDISNKEESHMEDQEEIDGGE
ncbi:O-fucosyltransferase 27 [Magnolia sinica]|uniref:O-fucosyltransferase 27 n=1 Tax=Magnolia sinica TaxID=86752 RepID=UPI002657D389|nr:O-fucosyltransferase 27 [Magnolia sinica]